MACLTPFTVKLKMQNKSVPVPCGKCPECRKRRVSGWSFRLMHEDRQSTSSLFITLTYDTTHVPITKTGFMSVQKRDVQLFLKKLRFAESKIHSNAIKYYLAAEYGTDSDRPHYHAIIFNVSDPYAIERAWGNGSIHYGTVTEASVGYTLKYLDKPRRIPKHRNDDRNPEFGLMSKGLGLGYITQGVKKWHLNDLDNRMYLTIPGGKKISMPRYYKDKIYTPLQRKQIQYFQLPKIEERKAKLESTPDYAFNKVQSDLAAFKNFGKQQKIDKL